MTLKDRLILIADLAYRFRQVDGSEGAVYDASMVLKIGQSLDAEIKALHEKLDMPYMKRAIKKQTQKSVPKFWLQPTTSFPDGAPQRESYDSDEALFSAEKKYEAEWRKEFKCDGCKDLACPQCGST